MDIPDFKSLRCKQRALYDKKVFSRDLLLRLRRAISWLGRKEEEKLKIGDLDACFIFLWMGFNSLYGKNPKLLPKEEREFEEANGSEKAREKRSFRKFLQLLVPLDVDHRIHEILLENKATIYLFLGNKYIFSEYWDFRLGQPNAERWEDNLWADKLAFQSAIRDSDKEWATLEILPIIFDRFYTIRNQLLHGSTCWKSGLAEEQIVHAEKIMSPLFPVFIDLVMDNPDADWGPPYYPRIDDKPVLPI